MKKWICFAMCMWLCVCAGAEQNWKAVLRYDKQQAKADLSRQLQHYAKQDSHATLATTAVPSTPQQLAFAKALAKELKHLGAAQVQVAKTAIVTAEIPATTTQPRPTIALIAHLDAPEQAQAQTPQLYTKYTGGDIVLDKDQKISLTEENSPQLHKAHGHDFVMSNGQAAFGADSKAGLSIVMTLADYLLGNTALQHGPIKIILLPDTSSHAGAKALDIQKLAADYAYVLDGQDIGEITTGNFSGRSFTVVFEGRRNIPLGQAISTVFTDNLLMASDFHTLLPRHYRPETTAGKKGYITVDAIQTQGNRTVINGHIRAFTEGDLQMLSEQVTQAFNTVKAMNPRRVGAELSFQDEFANVRTQLPPALITSLRQALKREDISAREIEVRNYADFAALTAAGLSSIGVFTGVFHGGEPLEYADVDIMEASLRGLLSLISAENQELIK